jgi:hypothetical protein
MKFIEVIINDLRNRQNLDFYITVIISLIVAIFGISQSVSQEVISSAILAILALVSLSLLINRRENDEIKKSLSITKDLKEEFINLASGLGTKVSFIEIGTELSHLKYVTQLVQNSLEEILVLDWNPLEQVEEDKVRIRYSDEMYKSELRKAYYDAILEKIQNDRSGKFRYRRVLQIPKERSISDVIGEDPIFRDHCDSVVKLGERRPENVCLKVSNVLHEGSYIIIDNRYLIFDMAFIDPFTGNHGEGGTFFFDDPTSQVISIFRRFYERADARAVIVKSNVFQSSVT